MDFENVGCPWERKFELDVPEDRAGKLRTQIAKGRLSGDSVSKTDLCPELDIDAFS
jgi:hypothetical protein